MNNSEGTTERKRGGCLSVFLILAMVLTPLSVLFYLFAGSLVGQAIPEMPGWFIPVMVALCIVLLLSVIAIWKWKRWGVYAYFVTAAITFIVNIISLGFQSALSGLVGVLILFVLIRPVWRQMD